MKHKQKTSSLLLIVFIFTMLFSHPLPGSAENIKPAGIEEQQTTNDNAETVKAASSKENQEIMQEETTEDNTPEPAIDEEDTRPSSGVAADPTTAEEPIDNKDKSNQENTRVTNATSSPDVNMSKVHSYVNAVAGRRAVNNSDKPYLADRYNQSEYVDPTTAGSLSLKYTDLTLPGRDGLDLVIGRYYNSNEAVLGSKRLSMKRTLKTCTSRFRPFVLITVDPNRNPTTYEYGIFDSESAAYLVGESVMNDEKEKIWVSYKVQTDDEWIEVGDEYLTYEFINYNDADSYLRQRWDLGAGWSFNFPSIEIQQPLDEKYYIFHDGQGAAYEIKITKEAGDSNLNNYQGMDIVVDKCATLQENFTNDEDQAYWVYIERGQKYTYFSEDGRIIGIKDLLGNKIKFTYCERIPYYKTDNNHEPTIPVKSYYIKTITDSVGRTIKFDYVDNKDICSQINVTVQDPGDENNNLTLSYKKGKLQYQYNEYDFGSPDYNYLVVTGIHSCDVNRDEPVLSAYTDPVGNETQYYYGNKTQNEKLSKEDSKGMEVKFSYNNINELASRSTLGLQGQDIQCILTDIKYPHSWSHYIYTKLQGNTAKRLGSKQGSFEEWVVIGRYDQELITDSDPNKPAQESPTQKNYATYKSDGNYTKKIDSCSRTPNLTDTYTFTATRNGITTTQKFNYLGQEKQEISTDGTRTVKTLNEYTNPTFEQKPTKSAISISDNSGTGQTRYIYQNYNSTGDLAIHQENTTENDTQEKLNRTVQYVYGAADKTKPANQFLLNKKTWNQSKGVGLSETYDYDKKGRLIKSTNANGEETIVNYSDDGRTTTTSMSLGDGREARTEEVCGPESNYAYPTQVTKYNDNDSITTTTTYDMLLGLPTSVTDSAGNTISYVYDPLGRIICTNLPSVNGWNVWQDVSYTTQQTSGLFDKYNEGLLSTRVDSATIYQNPGTGEEKEYNRHQTYYNAYGQLLLDTILDENDQPTVLAQYHYDDDGNLIYEIDAEGNSWTYQYNKWGELTSCTDPPENTYTENISYQGGQKVVTSSFIPHGSTTPEHQFVSYFDQYGNPVKNQAAGIEENFEFDIAGNLTAHTDPRQNRYQFGYDKLNRLSQLTDPLNETISYTYTRLGQLQSMTIPQDNIVGSYEGPDLEFTLPDKDSSTGPATTDDRVFWQNGDKISGNTKTENAGNIGFSLADDASADPDIDYDELPYELGNGPYTTTWEYDLLGHLTSEKDPASISDSSRYNNLGQLSSYTDPNGVPFKYLYDSQGRLTSQSGGDINLAYTYGNHPFGADSITSNGDIAAYSYDDRGRVISSTMTCDSLTNEVSYAYDNTNNITSITSPGSHTTSYHYEKTRVDQVQYNGESIQYAYYPDGKIHTITYPTLENGKTLQTTYDYDSLNRLVKLSNYMDSTSLSEYSYAYDDNSNITNVTDSSGTSTYTYDKLDRLVKIQKPDGKVIEYSYDTRGNRYTQSGDISTLDQSEIEYSYNSINQLTSVNRDNKTTSFSYDPNGLRSKKTTPEQTTRYIYNSAGNIVAETDADNSLTKSYVWGPDQLLARQDANGSEYYYLYNGHGDVVQIIDRAGNIVNSYEYDEWGNISNQTETIDNDFKYTGQIFDNETGLYYLRARYYDPTIGRFISKDSLEGDIANPLSLNRYTYCENDPLAYWDPSGHMADSSLPPAQQRIIKKAQEMFRKAQANHDIIKMQIAHDAATNIRLAYSCEDELVVHVNYTTGEIEYLGGYLPGGAQPDEEGNFVIDTLVTLPVGGIGGAGSKLGGSLLRGEAGSLEGQIVKKEITLDLQLFAAKSPFGNGALSGKEVVKILKSLGYKVDRTTGSHYIMKGPNGNTIPVPVHGNKSLAPGTLDKIIKQAGY